MHWSYILFGLTIKVSKDETARNRVTQNIGKPNPATVVSIPF